MYDRTLQDACLEIRQTGIGANGLPVLFNRKPTDVITGGSYFQTGYDPSWYDPHGQTAYVSANYKF